VANDIFQIKKKVTLLIGMMKTGAYKVDRVMPAEAAICSVLTASLLKSS